MNLEFLYVKKKMFLEAQANVNPVNLVLFCSKVESSFPFHETS